ncbi:hypothetical protein ABZU76_02980 [Amycolatopsis sp. NPDC005232]|uniref:hypothetical protein n=1 Tax=Amycolatopsis sp. NPDC005232 TaxID=3157027 RepID=UPI0033B49D99
MVVSKEDLLAKTFGVEEFDVPQLGVFKIRPLTRAEALTVKDKELPVAKAEQWIIAHAVAEPVLSEKDVEQLQKQLPAGLFTPLTDRIAEISGMKKEAAKSGVPGVRK